MSTSETLVRMPKLADTLVEGTLGRWLKQVGEPVSQGEPLASIETDKVTTDLTSPAAGTLLEVLVQEGQTVAIETPIARIGDGSGVSQPPPPTTDVAEPPFSSERAPRIRSTPVAARLLAEHGLTPDQLPTRTARLTKADVLDFVQARTSAKLAPLSSMRRAIAEHMTKSRQTIPHGQSVIDVDLTELVGWREARKAEGTNLTFTVFFVHALALQLATLADGPVDLGVAVALDVGLIVPVVPAADQLTLTDLSQAINDLASRARAGQLKPHETQGARMTVTNVGSFGNLTASPIIPLGQLGILGPGLVERRPLPSLDGGIRPGWRCRIAFVFDRRHFDDFAADRFLRGVSQRLVAPDR